jgi:hypothetical protein
MYTIKDMTDYLHLYSVPKLEVKIWYLISVLKFLV